MTVSKVIITKHDKGAGWYRMIIISLRDFIGETKIELLLREEALRSIRNGADLALSGQPPLDTNDFFTIED